VPLKWIILVRKLGVAEKNPVSRTGFRNKTGGLIIILPSFFVKAPAGTHL
jgi:hypothetical protein